MSAGSSPVALTPGFSSISPLYPLPASPSSASSSSTTLDDAVGRLFTRFLPTFFDLLEKYQYQKALLVVDGDEETQWKSWTAFKVMLKLCASCESTYHLMKYLETEMVKTDTIEHMYGKLTVLMNHLADELKPMVARQSRHFSVHTPTPSNGHAKGSQNGGGEENGVETDPDLMMEIAMCGDMGYYVELLEQGAEFFSLRVPMLQLYRGLALASLPRDYSEMLKRLENLLLRFDTFDHPLLETMKQSAIEELSTVHAAIQCEVRVTEYDFTRSIVAMHRLKVQLRSWSEHIDAVSDYPLFEGNTVDLGAAGQDEGLLLEESDDSYDPTSNSVYSITSVSNLSTSSHSHSYLSYRGGRYANMGDTSLLRRGGLTSALPIRRALVQKPGDPYISSSGANSSVPSNTLEQVILGGGVNSVGTPVGGSNGLDTSQGGVNSGGGIAGSTNPLAAEMMASSMEMQERNDGFALPVFQWSKRFYRSLVAKFTLYFHRWLEPFMHGERRQKTTYHIAQVDEAMYLVLLVEGAKKTNEKVAQDFMQTVTENLQHSGAFGPRVLASPTAAST
ncbi:hypothetical protein BBO99_00003144 [Phytophthora kernoviae]|uniref:Uncharacterized protein n=2 Tax=Phytophthora kernoviae TaxID=325452 RepID=A0A421GV29_9STRA|nr:hypothetical protein G195_003431 [Phytophthora kernoviae 00238/432]KAG2528475.1 hypothetical protein JM16_002796 [Phytophthora kernoviae]KAG2530074.1 hypothetical protein JM18_002589 [Phytophthora kernoviae]RLM95351.1 hypothetical protein BBI17_003143 [Phytophthora kernoviae]RLN82122.1 hypothetical protein BBO99_00003144 [Phytophthora kernoviae]